MILNNIVLASTSSRRKNILHSIGLKKIKIINPQLDERKFDSDSGPSKIVKKLAFLKANSVKNDYKGSLIIAADTMVYRCRKIFHKPGEISEVRSHLKLLSGKKHFVYGGICVIKPNEEVIKRKVLTEVFFNRISCTELNNDLILNEGVGKAGGYAIQGYASRFIKKIKGCYSNVVGLSIPEIYKILKSSGLKI